MSLSLVRLLHCSWWLKCVINCIFFYKCFLDVDFLSSHSASLYACKSTEGIVEGLVNDLENTTKNCLKVHVMQCHTTGRQTCLLAFWSKIIGEWLYEYWYVHKHTHWLEEKFLSLCAALETQCIHLLGCFRLYCWTKHIQAIQLFVLYESVSHFPVNS